MGGLRPRLLAVFFSMCNAEAREELSEARREGWNLVCSNAEQCTATAQQRVGRFAYGEFLKA